VYEFILLERHDHVGVVTFNRPDRLNAWHSPMRHEIVQALDSLNADEGIRAIVLTGAGDQAFSAGQDLAETQNFDGDQADIWMDDWKRLYGSIRALDKPVVGAINGVAAGSAFQVALLCDVRVGHPGVRMGQTEINAGIPSITGTWLIWEILGRSRTVELVLTGRLMDAEECQRVGILHHLVPRESFWETSLRVARDLAAKPPIAMRLNKQRFRELTEPGFLDAEEVGRRVHREAFGSGEPQAVMARFFAERAARKAAPTPE
jgi:enoyl-CoA hydratase/carnithine racemase